MSWLPRFSLLAAVALFSLGVTSSLRDLPAATAGIEGTAGPLIMADSSTRSANGAAVAYNSHWSGYAQVGTKTGQFIGIDGAWSIPTVDTSLPGNQYVSDWVGIDGAFNNTDLIQVGTRSENIGGKAEYYVWTELLPNPPHRVPLTVHPGDDMAIGVYERAPNVWQFSVRDNFTNKDWESGKIPYTTPGEDAEAVHERPVFAHGPGTLAKTNDVGFLEISVYTGSFTNPIAHNLGSLFPDATLTRIYMTNQSGQVIASPSTYDQQYSCFVVADGSKPPSSC